MDNATTQQVMALEHRAQRAPNRYARATINGRNVAVSLNAEGKKYGARWTVDGVSTGYVGMCRALEPARSEAIAEADAHVNNVGLPSYTDLLAFVQRVADMSPDSLQCNEQPATARKLLGAV